MHKGVLSEGFLEVFIRRFNLPEDYDLGLENYKILSPTPKGRKVYVAKHTTGDMSKGSIYEVTTRYSYPDSFMILGDTGQRTSYHKSWFQEVTLYDEDEDDLICRDIEFERGDYIDLRKHTPDQIRHIAKFYKFFGVDDLLNSSYVYETVYLNSDKMFEGSMSIKHMTGKEYTYDDIFYKED